MTDAQLINRLKNLSTNAILSGDDIQARVLAEAAARITELSIIHHTWHPSMEEIATEPVNEKHRDFVYLVRGIFKNQPRFAMVNNGYEIALRLDGVYFDREKALEMFAYWSDLMLEAQAVVESEVGLF
jgi:hypothetical protein